MDFIYFLLGEDSSWLNGEVWQMPHRLWYEGEGGFKLGLIIMVFFSIVMAFLYFHVFPRVFRNVPLNRINWSLFLIVNATAIFLLCFSIARNGILNFAIANDYVSDNPEIVNVLTAGTIDMWLFAAQNATYSLFFFFIVSFPIRIKSRGRWIPF